MKRGLTRAGIGDVGSLESFVTKARQYGFDAVDAGGQELVELIATKAGADGARAWLVEEGVSIGSIGLSVEWRQSEETFREDLRGLATYAAAAAHVGCRSCCTYVLPSTDLNPATYMLTATRRLRTCAQVVHVHINDAPNVPVADVRDNGRLYPGEGVIDLAAFLQSLQTIGYEGVVAQEILTQSPPTEAPDALLQKSANAFARVFAAAGV